MGACAKRLLWGLILAKRAGVESAECGVESANCAGGLASRELNRKRLVEC